MILEELDKKIIDVFGVKSFITLNGLTNVKRVIFKNDNEELLFEEVFELMKSLFEHKTFFARITFWDINEFECFREKCISFNRKKDCYIALFEFNCTNQIFIKILKSHLNYEIGLEPYLNITVFFFNLDLKTLVNIYDDRGADYLKVTN